LKINKATQSKKPVKRNYH